MEQEALQPPWTEVLGHVNVSTYKSWDDMGKWYWGLVQDQLVADDEVRRRAESLTQGLKDDRAKARAIYDYVVQKTRYVALEFGIHGFKPYRCAQIFARGFGDCKDKATLIVTMLGALGIKAIDAQAIGLAQRIRLQGGGRQRRQEAALGLDVRVAHVVADHRADTGEFATTRHGTNNLRENRDAAGRARARAGDIEEGRPPRQGRGGAANPTGAIDRPSCISRRRPRLTPAKLVRRKGAVTGDPAGLGDDRQGRGGAIARALNSARPHVDAMIVLDTGSTDATREIAARLRGARLSLRLVRRLRRRPQRRARPFRCRLEPGPGRR